MSDLKIPFNNYVLEFEEPVLYVDNEKRGRSGHMTHAMAEFAPNCFIDFNSNCTIHRIDGHTPYGFIEYRISRDGGNTYSDIQILDYSMKSLLDGVYAISVEKAVACDDGTIVAFCLRNNAIDVWSCLPWVTPTVVRSTDQGKTWSEPVECIPFSGRIYDAIYKDGVIYVLIFCNPNHLGKDPEQHKYRVYKSFDNGVTFEEASVIPFDIIDRGYGSFVFDGENRLHAYTYYKTDETLIDHAVSDDFGLSWEIMEQCHVDKGVRNPQTAYIDGIFVMHGRSADEDKFVFYASLDGSVWSDAAIIAQTNPSGQYYSNNLILNDENGNFLLVQYSEQYHGSKVNVKHLKMRVRKL